MPARPALRRCRGLRRCGGNVSAMRMRSRVTDTVFQTAVFIRKHNLHSQTQLPQTQLRDLAARFARVLPSTSRPLQSEGAGNAGRPMRPIAARAMVVVERTRVSQVTPESPGIPRAMVYGLFRALPGDRAFLPPSPAGLTANLTPASGRQDHTSSPSASAPFVRERLRVHRIPPRVGDVAQRPSVWDGMSNNMSDLDFGKTEIFLQRGLDRPSAKQPVGQIRNRRVGKAQRAHHSRRCG
jgi:hypothetical protein